MSRSGGFMTMARTGQTEIKSFLYALPADVGEVVVALRKLI